MVNLDVINRLDTHLYGTYPEGTPAMSSFWENVYHVEDDLNYPYKARYSTYQSFLRQAVSQLHTESNEKCEIPQQVIVKEVTVLRVDEVFKGLIITLKEGESKSLSPPEFEVRFAPVNYLQKYAPSDAIASRVASLEVRRQRGKSSYLLTEGILGEALIQLQLLCMY